MTLMDCVCPNFIVFYEYVADWLKQCRTDLSHVMLCSWIAVEVECQIYKLVYHLFCFVHMDSKGSIRYP